MRLADVRVGVQPRQHVVDRQRQPRQVGVGDAGRVCPRARLPARHLIHRRAQHGHGAQRRAQDEIIDDDTDHNARHDKNRRQGQIGLLDESSRDSRAGDGADGDHQRVAQQDFVQDGLCGEKTADSAHKLHCASGSTQLYCEGGGGSTRVVSRVQC